MTGFGPPPSSPPPAGPGVSPSGGPIGGLGLGAILGYVAGGLALLDFVWGFLDVVGNDTDGFSGYVYGGGAAVGLAIAAGLWAAGAVWSKDNSAPLGPVALGIAALLVSLGNVAGQPDGGDTKIGAILALITNVVLVVVLVYAWLLRAGRIAPPQPRQQAPQGYGPPPGYGAPQGPPPGYGAPQGPPPGYGPPQGPPPGYGRPQGPPPGYGAPQGPTQGGQPGPSFQKPAEGQGGFGPASSFGSPQGDRPAERPTDD